MIGLELCGTYLLDDSWDGLTNTAKPLTSVEQITRVLDAMPGAPGLARAREALVLVGDGSNSPMESVLCALLTWPRRLGEMCIRDRVCTELALDSSACAWAIVQDMNGRRL